MSLDNLPQTANESKIAVQAISQILFEMEVQIHILHLQAIKKKFEIHDALGKFYESLGDLNDDLVEKSYCKVGILNGYKSMNISNQFEPLPYIQGKMSEVEMNREKIKEGYIQQIIDNILEQFAHVIYRLENLQ